MKKILITGSEGFIGSHLVERLMTNKAYQLHLLVQYNSFSNKGWLNDLKLKQNIKIIFIKTGFKIIINKSKFFCL